MTLCGPVSHTGDVCDLDRVSTCLSMVAKLSSTDQKVPWALDQKMRPIRPNLKSIFEMWGHWRTALDYTHWGWCADFAVLLLAAICPPFKHIRSYPPVTTQTLAIKRGWQGVISCGFASHHWQFQRWLAAFVLCDGWFHVVVGQTLR